MRGKLLFLAMAASVLLCSFLVVSVEAASMWSKTYGGETEYETASSMVATSDGGYAIVGLTDQGVWLVKTDAFGNMQWNQTYGGGTYVYAYSLVETPDEGYAIAGSIGDSRSEVARLLKTDALGNMQWSKSYGGGWGGAAYSLVVTSDGGFALAGYYTPPDPRFPYRRNLWLAKTDAAGTLEWNWNYDVGSDVSAKSLVATPDGGYAIAAGSGLFKTDALGNLQWNKTYQGSIASLIVTHDGGFAGCGSAGDGGTSIDSLGSSDFWLVKTDASGNLLWNKTYGKISQDDFASSLIEKPEGGYAVAGTWNYAFSMNLENMSDYHFSGDAWLVKTDALGKMLWNRTYGGDDMDEACSLVACSDGGYTVAGGTRDLRVESDLYYSDIWLIKTDEFGIVPEFPALMLLPSLMILTLTASMLFRRRERT